MEFEFCNVYRGTFGKTLPLMQRHPDAVVILWNLKDYDHVFFVTLSQLVPCFKDMSADHWSMIVFWNESSSKKPSSKPDVGLDYTDEPVPLPPPTWTLEDSPGERRRRRYARTSGLSRPGCAGCRHARR